MQTLYTAIKIKQTTAGAKSFVSSSFKESKNETEAQVSGAISNDMKDAEVLCSTNLSLASDGSVGLKKYFTHNGESELPYYVTMQITQFTEESQKTPAKRFFEFDNAYDAEQKFWENKSNAMKDADVDCVLNLVFNWHGGVEISDFWIQYPVEPEPESEV